MFNRPPPPYPGQGPMRGPMRFPGPFPGDQRFPFPNEGQGPRTPLPGDPTLRHQGPRLVLYPYFLQYIGGFLLYNTIFDIVTI